MLILQNISYTLPTKDLLFCNIHWAVNNNEKIALIGNNGAGKSTLLKIIAGELSPSSGTKILNAEPYFVPQIFGQYNHLTIAQALKIDQKLIALNKILNGSVSEQAFAALADDWTIEERCNEALRYWQLSNLRLEQTMDTLSGGQKTRVFLAGISIHNPKLLLFDEPSNHLDSANRRLLYNFIQASKSSIIVVSHDRTLLNKLDTMCELSAQGIKVYGGNYDFYSQQKHIETAALNHSIQSHEKALRKAKEKEQETLKRQQKLDNRGKSKQEKAGTARIMMNTLRNNAENSTSKLKSVHAEKIDGISQELHSLRASKSGIDAMQFGFDNSKLHKGKILVSAQNINFAYNTQLLWAENLSFQITSGERIALKGANASGKTTLIQLILGKLEAQTGSIQRASSSAIYIDQDYSLINNSLSVYEQAQTFNNSALLEHEIKIRLNRFLFTKESWNKSCAALSGGERMRLVLCCLTIASQSPDIIILDEPTNNLDIQNIHILTAAINGYCRTLIVVSHDDVFLQQIGIEREFDLLSL